MISRNGSLRSGRWAGRAVIVFLTAGIAQIGFAQPIYNSIPSPIPGNVASEGPEAYAFAELGDGIVFAPNPPMNTLSSVKVVMSDWACTSGHWFNAVGTADSCITGPAGATFRQPITVKIYRLNAGSPPTAGVLLASATQVFDIPYRPAADDAQCGVGGVPGGDGQEWYSATDNACYHGIAFPIVFDLSTLNLVLPGSVIITVSFNTTHYGPSPVGEGAACFASDNNCPYDSLNISTFGNTPSLGSFADTNGIFVNYANAANSCNPQTTPTGILLDDTPCFTGFHPEIEVDVGYNILFFEWFFAG